MAVHIKAKIFTNKAKFPDSKSKFQEKTKMHTHQFHFSLDLKAKKMKKNYKSQLLLENLTNDLIKFETCKKKEHCMYYE